MLKAGLENENAERSLPYWALPPAVVCKVIRTSKHDLWQAAWQEVIIEEAPHEKQVLTGEAQRLLSVTKIEP